MMNQKIKLIFLSTLMALALWSKPIVAMEAAKEEFPAVAFRPLCVVLDNSSRLQLRLTCTIGAFNVNETYNAINNDQGVTCQWDNLSINGTPINGTLRYYLNQHTSKFLWLLNKSERGLMSFGDGANLTILCNHIGNFPLFVGQENMGSNLFTICLAQLTSSDDLPKQARNTFASMLSLPGNACVQEIGRRASRIAELQSQDPQSTAEDLGVWKELFTIDPNMVPANFIMAVNACYAQIGQIIQLHSATNGLSSEDYQTYIIPLYYDNYNFIKRFIPLYAQQDETMKNMRLNHWSNCNTIKKYQEAYEQFMILEGEFGFGLPSVDNQDYFPTIHHFVETFSHYPNVKPEHFEALETYLRGKGENSLTIETFNTGYFLLARLYANRKIHQKLVNLYAQHREHFITSWDTLEKMGINKSIFNACLNLEDFDVALDILEQETIALNVSEGMEANPTHNFTADSSPQVDDNERIKKKTQSVSIQRSIIDFAKGNQEAALERMYQIVSTLNVSGTQSQALSDAASIQLLISLMEGKVKYVIQALEMMDQSDPTILFSLIYLKDKYYPSSITEIEDLKNRYFMKFNATYEEDMVSNFFYETAVFNILTKSNRVIHSKIGA